MTTDSSRTRFPITPTLGVIFFILQAIFPTVASAQFYPIYDRYDTISQDRPTSVTSVLGPLYEVERTTETTKLSIRPFYTTEWSHTNRDKDSYALWPLYFYREREEHNRAKDYERTYIFPSYFRKTEFIDEKEHRSRMLVPFYYGGEVEDGGNYGVLFPFLWYANNARLTIPLFPPRPQSFAAFWPFYGDFHNYWNSRRIRFYLWPLYIRIESGEKDSPDAYRQDNVIWPVFAKYTGEKVSGWRLFPLYGRVEKDDEFVRGYYLWPFGHFRSGKISSVSDREQEVSMFLPFYAKIRRPTFEFDLLFPFYGRLNMKGRESTGYGAAIYNIQKKYRAGVQEKRILWFIYRKQTVLDPEEIPEGITHTEDPVTGGGLFPFSLRYSNSRMIRRSTVWPLFTYRWNKYKDYEFTRRYVIPFYARKEWSYTNGTEKTENYLFPFFRYREEADGSVRSSSAHLFFYGFDKGIDSLYAPLWTFWETKSNGESGESMTRYFHNTWRKEVNAEGTVKKRVNLLFYTYESVRAEGKEKESSARFLFGLIGRHRTPELKTELLGFKF